MHDEATALMKTLIFTLDLIVNNEGEKRQRIANAYAEAQGLVATIAPENGSVRPRIVACFQRSDAYRAKDDIAAAGWILTAIRERIAEKDLPEWEKLATRADKAAQMLPPSESRLR
ncbi:hypothetical protein ELH72_08535 [Rhizobium ruizarguesonis]|uniref:hypothetical protein n=1 Tax=Rhizobium ruizarguesonis TaxID=2081791 RepID=UPI001030A15C|nr:hypothetical protein [Rhizobium ruizarguesonis]TAZ83306.1 hypothetical protein ELH72_08535 [Rhizobium ruizarguesonis]